MTGEGLSFLISLLIGRETIFNKGGVDMAKKTGGLTQLQQNFVDEYFVDFNITNSYIRAGYTVENAKRSTIHRMAYEVFKNPKVQAEIKERLERVKQDKDVILQKLIAKAIDIIDDPNSRTSDVLKAMEYLGKLYALGTENVNVNSDGVKFNFVIEPATKDKE